MARYLLLSDIHAADRAPASCTDSYRDDILDLLRQTVARAHTLGCSGVVWAGDVFHHKAPSRVSHKLVGELIDIGLSYEMPWYIVPGNHDMQHDREDSVMLTQPLGQLIRAGAVILNGWGMECKLENLDRQHLFGVPWQQGYGAWTEESDNAVGHALSTLPGMRDILVVAHAPLYPPGKELPYEYFPAARWAEAMQGRGYVFYGHVHEEHGIYEAGGVTFCNFGALSRGSLHEYNLTRVPKATMWDSETGSFTAVPLKGRPAEEVFRLTEAQEKVDMKGSLDGFLQQIGSTTLEVLSPESVIAAIRAKGLGKDVEDLVEELLAGAQ